MRRVYKYLTVIISLLVVFAVFSSSAFAECSTSQLIQNTDMRIQQSIDTNVSIADNAVTHQSNLAILLDGTQSAGIVYNTFENLIDKTTNRLITITDSFAAHSVDMAAKNGDTVISEYIEVNIGGDVVLVDPIRMY